MVSRLFLRRLSSSLRDAYLTAVANHPISDRLQFAALHREIKQLETRRRQLFQLIEETKQLLSDSELSNAAHEELKSLSEQVMSLDDRIKEMILEQRPRRSPSATRVQLELVAGAGGAEAQIFTRDLANLYSRLAAKSGWDVEVVSENCESSGDQHQLASACYTIEGGDAARVLKYEAGVHRVQRVPATAKGEIMHTSTCGVSAIEDDGGHSIEVLERDCEMTAVKSSGPGGQRRDKKATAVQILHKPTGVRVVCEETRFQQQNRERALRKLRMKLLEMEENERNSKLSSTRKSHFGSTNRNEKIRTYNFPANRITDHRINQSVSDIQSYFSAGAAYQNLLNLIAVHESDREMVTVIEELTQDLKTDRA